MESLYFLVLLFFIAIIIIPLSLRIKMALNLYESTAIVSIFLWKIKVVTLKIIVKDKSIFILTKKKKKQLEITLSIKQIYFVEQLTENLKDKLQIRKIAVYSKLGFNDAYKTSMFCGAYISLIKTLFCYIKNKKPTCSLSNYVTPCFNKDAFIVCAYLSSAISLFDLLYTLIISLFSLRRKVYERFKSTKRT